MYVNGHFSKTLFLGCFLIVLGWAVTASADWTNMNAGVITSGWVCTHGHAGQIEYPARVTSFDAVNPTRIRLGWGLDFIQAPGTENWVHYAVPVPVGHKTRHINTFFATRSIDVSVTDVGIYDGATLIELIPVIGWTANNEYISQGVTLSADHVVEGALGVSIRVAAGIESLNHGIIFAEVCADMFP